MNDQRKASRLSRICQLLRAKQNILIVVGENPTTDQLLSGVCLASILRQIPINKQVKTPENKASEAIKTLSTSESQSRNISVVFKDKVHAGLEFLNIDSFISKSTNSYRDLILSIDSDKVDKLRYNHLKGKKLVNVSISPYRNSEGLSESDINYSLGKINIDAVLALGISNISQLDNQETPPSLLTENPVVSFSCSSNSELFDSLDEQNRESVSWNVKKASCLTELVYELSAKLKYKINRDQAIIFMTALIVATDGFRVENTSTQTFKNAAEIRRLLSNRDHQNILSQIEKHGLNSSLRMSSLETASRIVAEKTDPLKPQTTIRKAKVESRQQAKRPIQTIEKLVGGSEKASTQDAAPVQPTYQQPTSPAKVAQQPAMAAASSQVSPAKPAMTNPSVKLSQQPKAEVSYKPNPQSVNHQSPTSPPKSAPSLDSIDGQKTTLTDQALPQNSATPAPAQSNLYQPESGQSAASRLQKPAQAFKQAPHQTAAVLARIQQHGNNKAPTASTVN